MVNLPASPSSIDPTHIVPMAPNEAGSFPAIPSDTPALNHTAEALSPEVLAPEVYAVPSSRASELVNRVASSLQDMSTHLASWQQPPQIADLPHAIAEPDKGHIDVSLTSAMQDAVASLQGSYMFAIEATLASRGSTEGTKVLNTLLKGQ